MQNNLSDQLYDIYGMDHIPFWQTTTFFIIVSLAGIAALVLGIWYAVRSARSRIPAKPAWERALIALNEICSKEVMTTERSKEFYDRLTAILKQYLHDRYGYETFGKTDQELLTYLEDVMFEPDLLISIRRIVDGSVMIKFANAQAIREQMERDIGASITIIKKTIPRSHHTL
jgi:hypothetical protein